MAPIPWPRPTVCPRCKGVRLWDHGYVTTFFDRVVGQVILRPYRRPECGCVLRARPAGYSQRIQAPIEAIRSSVAFRLKMGVWQQDRSRSWRGHWLRSFFRKGCARFGHGWRERLLEGFDGLMGRERYW